MRSLLLIFSFLFVSGLAAGSEPALPVFGQPSEGTILVSARGHSFSEPGDYHLTSNSLAAFMREMIKAVCDSDSDKIRIHREDSGQKYIFTIKFGDLRAGKDFTLKHGDIIMITCPYF